MPEAFTQLYPNGNYSRSSDWCGFPDPYGSVYLLDFADPLFNKLGNRFIELQTQEYGTDHIYNCDTFNEMNPSSADLAYLQSASANVYVPRFDLNSRVC